MNENIETNVEKLRPFTKILMTIGELPTSYLMSMTYYEQIIWFTKYLQEKVIPAINNNAVAVEELQRLYIVLQNYVNTYFDNLDIQEEINKKLDEMAESGELGIIISTYVNPILEEFQNNINQEVEGLSNKLDNDYQVLNDKLTEIITSGIAPIPVSSIGGMTDTSRIYVNTTDGKYSSRA